MINGKTRFLDAFRDTKPNTTVAKWVNGETILKNLDGDQLKYWLKEYSLGDLFISDELLTRSARALNHSRTRC